MHKKKEYHVISENVYNILIPLDWKYKTVTKDEIQMDLLITFSRN